MGEIGGSLPHPVPEEKAAVGADGKVGLKEVTGKKRSLRADLAVVDDLSRLHECQDEATVNQVLAIVARGLPVVTSASWSLARGDPDCVPKESVIPHKPLVLLTKLVFQYDAHFQARSQNLLDSLTALSKLPGSNWKVAEVGAQHSGRWRADVKGHEFLKLDGVAGVDVVRSWIQKHRQIHNVLGSRAWTLTERIV